MAEPHSGHFADDHHALAAGQVAGVLAGRFPGVELVDDAEGNHKPEVRLIIWGEAYRARVEPEPDEEALRGRTVGEVVDLIHHRVEEIIGNELPRSIWSELEDFFTEVRDEVAAGVWGPPPGP